MPNENSSNGVLLGTLIGGVVGAAAALLLAPKSGIEMREDLAAKFQSVSDTTKDIASSVGQNAKDLASTVKEETSNVAEHVKQSNETVMNALADATEDIKEDVKGSQMVL